MTTVSFCITCYDKDSYLVYGLLEQLKQQTQSPDEIIIYCSGQDSLLNIPKFITINNNLIPIYIIISNKRTNQAVARNICSKIAKGDYIILFDVDDVPHPQKIEITKHILEYNNINFLLHSYSTKSLSNTVYNIENLKLLPITEIDETCTNVKCGSHPIHHSHITVKRSLVNNINFNEGAEFYRKEDGKFCQDLILNNYYGHYCPFELIQYN